MLLLCNEVFRSPRWYFASTFCTTVHNQKQSRNSMYIATTSVVPIYVCTTYLNGTKSCMMSSPLFDLNQNRCILPEYCPQNYSILPDWNHPRRNYPSFQPHNTVPDRFRKAINISRKSNKIYKKWVEVKIAKPWLKVGQVWTFRNLRSLMSWLQFFAHDWPKSCEKGVAGLGLTMLVSCRQPYLVHLYFFVVLKILLFDASLSHKMIDIWSSFLCLR